MQHRGTTTLQCWLALANFRDFPTSVSTGPELKSCGSDQSGDEFLQPRSENTTFGPDLVLVYGLRPYYANLQLAVFDRGKVISCSHFSHS